MKWSHFKMFWFISFKIDICCQYWLFITEAIGDDNEVMFATADDNDVMLATVQFSSPRGSAQSGNVPRP